MTCTGLNKLKRAPMVDFLNRHRRTVVVLGLGVAALLAIGLPGSASGRAKGALGTIFAPAQMAVTPAASPSMLSMKLIALMTRTIQQTLATELTRAFLGYLSVEGPPRAVA